MNINRYQNPASALQSLTDALIDVIERHHSGPFHVALSGGAAIEQLFRLWTTDYRERVPWERLRFFWTDEAFLSPDDPRSHYGRAEHLLLRPLDIPISHIFPVWGSNDPATEARRYAEIVQWELPGYSPTPRFDACILDLAPDGTLAAISPDDEALLTDSRVYAVVHRPEPEPVRLTLTGHILLAAHRLLVTALGPDRRDTLLRLADGSLQAPASGILTRAAMTQIFTDCPAGQD